VPEDEGAFSQDAAVDDCLDLLDALAISRAHVLGVSMGAATALLMALRHPSRVASAVLIGAGGGALPHLRAAWAANMERMALRFESEHPRDVAQAFLDGPSRRALKSQDPVLFEEIADDLGSRSGRVSSALLRNVILRRPMLAELARELRECPTPMLVVSGSEDAHAVTAGEYLASGLRKHIVVAGAGHTPQIEQPERVALEVREFFRGVLAEDPE
jgi:pimeloyl-ACP methyl ester carboxylesterase